MQPGGQAAYQATLCCRIILLLFTTQTPFHIGVGKQTLGLYAGKLCMQKAMLGAGQQASIPLTLLAFLFIFLGWTEAALMNTRCLLCMDMLKPIFWFSIRGCQNSRS